MYSYQDASGERLLKPLLLTSPSSLLKLPKVIYQILQALRMLCKGCYQISMVLAFSYGQAKMTGIQYVNLVPRALLPGSKAREKRPGDEVDNMCGRV